MMKRGRYAFLTYLSVFAGLGLLVQLAAGAYGADRGLTNDEASHFVNSLLVLDFLRGWPVSGPIGFGLEYYEHFPRVSIGHWPPFYYIIQSAVLAVSGRSFSSLLGFQVLAAGLAAGLAGWVVRERQGFWPGLAAGFMVLCSPLLMFQLNAVMIDIFLGLLVLLAALAWARFARTGSLGWAMAFAALSVCAILSKGNAFGLALLPPLYCLFQRDRRMLTSWKTWLAALAVGCLTVPWYALTYRISSDGFVYGWGLEYSRLALSTYGRDLVTSLGLAGVAALLAGAWSIIRAPGPRDETLVSLLSATVAIFAFQCLVPTDIEARYLISLVPAGAVVAAHGIGEVARLAGARWRARPRGVSALTAGVLLFNALLIFRMPSVSTFHMDELMRAILESARRNPLVLVAGCPRAEGALIAAFAQTDTARGHYIIRGFKALASDDFMGTRYKARFASEQELAAWLTRSRIGWIVVDTSRESMAWLHTRQVLNLLDDASSGWRRVAAYPHGDGETRLYASDLPEPSPELIRNVLDQVAPEKVIGRYQGWSGR